MEMATGVRAGWGQGEEIAAPPPHPATPKWDKTLHNYAVGMISESLKIKNKKQTVVINILNLHIF